MCPTTQLLQISSENSQGSRGGCHLDLMILLPQRPKDWDNRPVSPHLAPISLSPSSPLKRVQAAYLRVQRRRAVAELLETGKVGPFHGHTWVMQEGGEAL